MSHLEDKLKKEDDYNSQPIGFSSRGGEIKHKLDGWFGRCKLCGDLISSLEKSGLCDSCKEELYG